MGKDSLLPVRGGPGRVASSKFGEEASRVGPSLHSCRAATKLMENRFIRGSHTFFARSSKSEELRCVRFSLVCHIGV